MLNGAKSLRAAVRDVLGDDVAIQRCQWHKRENVLSYLPKSRHAEWRRKLPSEPRVHFHFTPTSASWLNLVERFFGELTER